MRSSVVFVVLILMLGGLATALVMRNRTPHKAVAPAVTATASATTSASAKPSALASAATTPSASAPAKASASAANTASSPSLDRPLRVIALGWDQLAAGIAANDGADPGNASLFKKQKLDVRLTAKRDANKVENALARGGADEKGADIALLPLPRFVASYERLKALKPVIFFVAGWSEGRDVVLSKFDSFGKLPRRGVIELRAQAGAAACFLGLFALDLAGVDLDRVKITEGGGVVAAITRREAKKNSEQTSGHTLLTTGEASRLVPYVAIAQAGLIAKHGDVLTTWTKLWLKGHKLVAADAGAVARKIAAIKSGPEPLEVLARMSEVVPASLAENAHGMGLAGRGAVTLPSLFQRSWRIWRAAKVLTIPPAQAPVDGTVVARLVRANTELAAPDAGGNKNTAGSKDKALVVYRAAPDSQIKDKLNDKKLIDEIGFVAGVFRRSPIRVTAHPRRRVDSKRSQALIDGARQRFGLAIDRIVVGKARPKLRTTATIEVMPVP